MSDIKSLKKIDLASITIMGASVNFFLSVIIAVVLIIYFSASGLFNLLLIFLLISIVFLVLIFSIPDFFGRTYLFNFLIPRLKEINLEISDEKITNISVFPSALVCSIISMIITAILYPILFTMIIIFSYLLQSIPGGFMLLSPFIFVIDPLNIIYSFFFSFISVAIATLVFNLVSPKLGGLKLELSQEGNMTEINSINFLNFALIVAIILAILGLIFSLIISLISGVVSLSLILYLVLGGFVIGFVFGALITVLYNFLAPKMGGLKIELE